MPKHVALGLTMRHMTGLSSLIGILNGLRHSVSDSAVLEHDTATTTYTCRKPTREYVQNGVNHNHLYTQAAKLHTRICTGWAESRLLYTQAPKLTHTHIAYPAV